MNDVVKYLQECGTFFLATVEGDQPHVRPFGAVCEFEGKLYIVTNNKKDVYNQMKVNGKVEMCGMNKGTWIRVKVIPSFWCSMSRVRVWIQGQDMI